MAIIVSDDVLLTLIPLARTRIVRAEVLRALETLESATHENYRRPRSWLGENRFCLDAPMCERVNDALDRIESERLEVGEFILETRRFTQDPEFDESYYLPN